MPRGDGWAMRRPWTIFVRDGRPWNRALRDAASPPASAGRWMSAHRTPLIRELQESDDIPAMQHVRRTAELCCAHSAPCPQQRIEADGFSVGWRRGDLPRDEGEPVVIEEDCKWNTS